MPTSLTPDPRATNSLAGVDNAASDIPSPNALAPNGTGATADGASVDPNSQSSSQSMNVPLTVNLRSDDIIRSNALNDFIDVTYHVSLAMVSNSAVKQLEQDTVQGANLTPDDYIVFCSTGDVDTGVTSTERDYYNIKSFSFNSFLGHLPQNPIVAAVWDGKMKLVEPYGFNLREDLEIMSQALGYPQQVSPHNFIYRLEISFSGWRPTDGAWIRQIDIPVNDSRKIKSVIYYLTIPTVEARVTSIGTEYDLSFQPFAHLATRAESIILHKDTMPTSDLKGSGTASVQGKQGTTFRQFLVSLSLALHNQVFTDTQKHVDITYEFLGFKQLFDSMFIQDVSADVSTGITFNAGSGSYVVAAKSIDLYTLISHVMDALQLVRDLRLREDDPNFTQPGTEWNIRTNIKQADSPDGKINNYSTWTFQYIIEPVLTVRCRCSEVQDRNGQADFANQSARVQKMADLGMIIRKYDYLFTNNNSEIVDFQFRFKNFFYAPYPYAGPETTMRGHGQATKDTTFVPDKTGLATGGLESDQAANTTPSFGFTIPNNASVNLQTILGVPVPPASATNQNNFRNVFGGFGRGPSMPITQGISNADNQKQQKNLIARDQYLRYDMLDAQMTVRFDPTWLLNPYMSGGDYTAKVSTDSQEGGVFCYCHVDRVVLIQAYRPNQKSFMNPDLSTFSVHTSPILGGFYQVVTVVNHFENGRMTQDLNMVKYDHLNYFVDTVFNSSGNKNNTLTPDPGVSTGGL